MAKKELYINFYKSGRLPHKIILTMENKISKSLASVLSLIEDCCLNLTEQQVTQFEVIDGFLRANKHRKLQEELRCELWREYGKYFAPIKFPDGFFATEVADARRFSYHLAGDSVLQSTGLTLNLDYLCGESGHMGVPANMLDAYLSMQEHGCKPKVYLGGGLNNKGQFETVLEGLSEPQLYAKYLSPYIDNIAVEGGVETTAQSTTPGLLDYLVASGATDGDAVGIVLANPSYIGRKAQAIREELEKPCYEVIKYVDFYFLVPELDNTLRVTVPDTDIDLLKPDYEIAGIAAMIMSGDLEVEDHFKSYFGKLFTFCLSMGWPDFLMKLGYDEDTARLLVALSDMRLRWIEEHIGYDIAADVAAVATNLGK